VEGRKDHLIYILKILIEVNGWLKISQRVKAPISKPRKIGLFQKYIILSNKGVKSEGFRASLKAFWYSEEIDTVNYLALWIDNDSMVDD